MITTTWRILWIPALAGGFGLGLAFAPPANAPLATAAASATTTIPTSTRNVFTTDPLVSTEVGIPAGRHAEVLRTQSACKAATRRGGLAAAPCALQDPLRGVT